MIYDAKYTEIKEMEKQIKSYNLFITGDWMTWNGPDLPETPMFTKEEIEEMEKELSLLEKRLNLMKQGFSLH